MSGLLASTLGPRIELSVEVPQDLPAARADANQLEMALLNLTVNARDAMPEGGHCTYCLPHVCSCIASGQVVAGKLYFRITPGTATRAGWDSETLARCIEHPLLEGRGGTRHVLWAVDGAPDLPPGSVTLRITSQPEQGHALNSGYQVTADLAVDADCREEPRCLFFWWLLLLITKSWFATPTADMLVKLQCQTLPAGSAEDALRILANRRVDLSGDSSPQGPEVSWRSMLRQTTPGY